jgi:hypothetical protein
MEHDCSAGEATTFAEFLNALKFNDISGQGSAREHLPKTPRAPVL